MIRVLAKEGEKTGNRLNGQKIRRQLGDLFPCYETPEILDMNQQAVFQAETIDIYNLTRHATGKCLDCPASRHCLNRKTTSHY